MSAHSTSDSERNRVSGGYADYAIWGLGAFPPCVGGLHILGRDA